ncbi:MAG: SDR family oxidoreductase [Candidatus Eremiobacteraeota bacterium]|nr:SDR family oxidoreductase [Candidatus Eremiobacteraeota bacterium]
MHILVTGSTGYIGGRLVPLLREAGHHVRCLARNSGRLNGRFGGAEVVEGDVSDASSIERACTGIDVAYYLVHAMSDARNFRDADRKGALAFASAARDAGVKRIIYLGGLGEDAAALSPHLRSRHEVGDILRQSGILVIEFRAAVIIGSGSVSFEMMRYLTERLPVMIAPRWVDTMCQPIAVRDVLAYLTQAISLKLDSSQIYEIGGSDVLSYKDMMLGYAGLRGLKRTVFVVPLFTPRLSSYWVHLVTPISARIAQPLILGLHNEVVVRDKRAARDFPEIQPVGFATAVTRALDRYRTIGPVTTWFDAFDVRRLPHEFSGVREGMLIDRRERTTNAAPSAVAGVFESLGGKRGWLYGDGLWKLRGLMDLAVGGVGLRRGRRSATELRLGDAVDFWRVDAYKPGEMLRLRAEMRLPGKAWLEFEAEPGEGGRTRFRQTAFFEPRGLFGYIYWYSVAIFHGFIFGNMANRIVHIAESSALPKRTSDVA